MFASHHVCLSFYEINEYLATNCLQRSNDFDEEQFLHSRCEMLTWHCTLSNAYRALTDSICEEFG